jgi:hypothetical protein
MLVERLARSSSLAVVLLALGCGSSSNEGGGGGTTGSGGAGGALDGSAGALADASPDATGIGPYPNGPYGTQVGDVLADLETEGYLRHETGGYAYQASFETVRLSDLRATAPVGHALIHISGFT